MKIEVKDKYTGKNIKEPNSEIPDPPKPEPEKKSTDKKSDKKSAGRRRRKTPVGFIITIAAIVGVIAGVVSAILIFTKKSPLVGTWVRQNDIWTYEFKEDGTGSYGLGFGTPMAFHYKDEGDHVEITYDKNGNVSNFDYHFEDESLIIKDQFGKNVTYQKKGSETKKSENQSPSPSTTENPEPSESEEPTEEESLLDIDPENLLEKIRNK